MTEIDNLPSSPRVEIPNFVNADFLELYASQHYNQRIGLNVTITAAGGGCRFQHSMKPEQARNMAAELVKAADWIEANQVAYA